MKTKLVTFSAIMAILLFVLLVTASIASSELIISNIEVSVTNDNAIIEWNKLDNATGYDIYLEIPTLGYQYVGSVFCNKVKITGLEEGKMYSAKVQAYQVNGGQREYSDFSPEIEFKIGEDASSTSKLKKITNIKAQSYGTTGTVEWDDVDNADGYEVYASVGNSSFQNLGEINTSNVKLTGMHINEVYSVKVKPFLKESNGEKVYGSFSDIAILKYSKDDEEVVVKPDKVRNLTVSMNEDVATLSWNEVDEADGYQIVVELPNEDAIYYSDDNSKVLEGFSSHYTYKAKVRAYVYVNGEKKYGDFSSKISIRYEKEVKQVKDLRVSIDDEDVTFKWDEVKDADGYEVKVYTPKNGTKTYWTEDTNKTLNEFLEDQGEYSVKVRAYEYLNGNKVYGKYSDTKYFEYTKHIELDKVTGLTVDLTGTKAVLKWNSVKNADGYEILIDLPDGDEREISTTGTKFTIHNLDEMIGEYSVKIRAYVRVSGEKFYGNYSNVKDFAYYDGEDNGEVVSLPRVTGLRVKMDGDKATFTWNEVKNAAGYKMEIYIPGVGTTSYFIDGNTKVLTGFTQTKYDYTVRVRAYRGSEYGAWSSKAYFRNEAKPDDDDEIETPAKVTGLKVVRDGDKATFTWNEVKGAKGYKMEIYIPGVGTTSYFIDDNTKVLTGFTQTKYKYTVRVRAYVNSNIQNSYGEWSSTKEF